MDFSVEKSRKPQFFSEYIEQAKSKEIESAFNMLSITDQKILITVTQKLKTKKVKLTEAEKNVMQKYLTRLHDIRTDTFKNKLVFVVRSILSRVFPSRIFNKELFLTSIRKKPLTQKALRGVLNELQAYKAKHPGKEVDFTRFIQAKGFSKDLMNLNFSIENLTVQAVPGIGITPRHSSDLFKNVKISGLSFTNCKFPYLNFSHSQITNSSFDHCNLKNATFGHAQLKTVHFIHTDLKDSNFDETHLENIGFYSSNLNYASFFSAKCHDVTIDSSSLTGACFLAAEVNLGRISNCDLENVLLFDTKDKFQLEDCTENSITKPIVALAWDRQKPGYTAAKTQTALIEQGAIPLRFHYLPEEVITSDLEKEVQNQLKKISRIRGREPEAIPIELIKRSRESQKHQTPEINKLYERAELVLKHSDALLLPGGADIQPEFYDQLKAPKTVVEPDYRRSVLEFSLIYQAREKGIPFMGVCRGSQIGNIYFGGSLKQHVEGHQKVIQRLQATDVSPETGVGIIRKVADNALGVSIHHQAIDVVPEALEPVLEAGGIPKAIEGTQGSPMLMLQFHPEFKKERSTLIAKIMAYRLSQANIDILDAFIDSAITRQRKKTLHTEITPEALRAQKARLKKID